MILQVKCLQYWPDDGSQQYADIQVELVSVEEYTDFKIRKFKASQVIPMFNRNKY